MKTTHDEETGALYFRLSNIPLGKIRGRVKTDSHEDNGIILNVDTAETKSGEKIIYGIEVIGIKNAILCQTDKI